MVGGWLAGAQGKAVGPGLRGGVGCGSRLTGWWELAVEGNWTWKDWGPEGRRAAGGGNLRPVPNLVGQDMVSARDAKEPPELMAAMLHDHPVQEEPKDVRLSVCAVCRVCRERHIIAVLPLPHRFSICSVFCHLCVPFPCPVGIRVVSTPAGQCPPAVGQRPLLPPSSWDIDVSGVRMSKMSHLQLAGYS